MTGKSDRLAPYVQVTIFLRGEIPLTGHDNCVTAPERISINESRARPQRERGAHDQVFLASRGSVKLIALAV